MDKAQEYLKEYRRQQATDRRTRAGLQEVQDMRTRDTRDSLEEIRSIEQALKKRLIRCKQIQESIKSCIDQVEDTTAREILQQRYIDGNTWEVIAESTGYSLRSTYRKHRQALREIEKFL